MTPEGLVSLGNRRSRFSICVHALLSHLLVIHSTGPTNIPLYGNLGLATHLYEGLLLISGSHNKAAITFMFRFWCLSAVVGEVSGIRVPFTS